MSDLAQLLELLYGARDRWRAVRATLHEWTHLERSQLAHELYLQRTMGVRGPSVAAGAYGDGPGQHPPELGFETRVWLEEGGRFREEREGQQLTIVSDGTRALISSPDSGSIEHESPALRPSADALFDPAVLIPTLELAPAGETTALGRRALVVEAAPRLPALPPTDLVPNGCDGVTLHVDAERGILLRIEARLGDEPVRVLAVTSIAFDEDLPAELFRVEPPPGETIRSAADAYPTRQVTLEEAAGAASFTVWSPAQLAGGWTTHVLYRPETERPRLPESVTILFFDGESLQHFGVEQAAERLLAWRTGGERVVEADGLELRVVGGDRLPGPPLEVTLERGGTHVRIYSDNLDEARLVDLATSLAPVAKT